MNVRWVAILVLIPVLAFAGLVIAHVAASAQMNAAAPPGPPASIRYSALLPQEFPAMAAQPAGDILIAGAGVERIAAGTHQVTKILALPRKKISQDAMPVVRDLAAGAGVVAATGESIGTWPVPLGRHGVTPHPRGASTLVAWRVLPDGSARYISLGGTCSASPRAIAIGPRGDVVVTGVTTSVDFPVRHAAQATFAGSPSATSCPRWHTGLQDGDVFLTRIDPRGHITYSTYLGGSDADEPRVLAVDSAGNMYVAGLTYSSDFPHVRGFMQRGHGPVCFRDQAGNPHYCWRDFVAKLDRAGRLMWVTMLPLGSDSGEVHGIAADRHGVYLVGDTVSGDLPTRHAAQPSYGGGSCSDYDGLSSRCRDAWVTKLTPDGQMVFTTYLGGSGDDTGTAIVVGRGGAIYVAGTTDSIGTHSATLWFNAFTDFPRIRNVNGAPGGSGQCRLPEPCGDAYVAKLTEAGRLIGSWALGGSRNENLTQLGIDAHGDIYVAGDSESCDFPVRQGRRLHQFPSVCPSTFVTELRIM